MSCLKYGPDFEKNWHRNIEWTSHHHILGILIPNLSTDPLLVHIDQDTKGR